MKKTESVALNINITISNNGKDTNSSPIIKIWMDKSAMISQSSIIDLDQKNKSNIDSWVEINKTRIDARSKSIIVNKLLDQIDLDRHHYLITWTYGSKKMGHDESKVENDIKNIRQRIIKLFRQNFSQTDQQKIPSDFPKQYYFKEKHKDGQYHIHLLMESVDPDQLATSLDKESFLLRFYTIRSKILKRKDKIITSKMIERWGEYKHHTLTGRTYESISIYDDWMISRFLCDYITHYRDGQRWGLSKLSNSPDNNHSKVIESKFELKKKIEYLNKDRYFMTNTGDFLGHLVPQYSDYPL